MDQEFELNKFCDYIYLYVQSDDNNSTLGLKINDNGLLCKKS